MTKMSNDLHDEWRTRLQFAHDYWEDKGLSANPKAENSAGKYIEYYRGNQWDQWGWAGVPPERCITVNVTLSNTNALMSRISKRYPQPIVTATQKSSDMSSRSRRVEVTLKYFMRELKMKRQVDRALLDGLIGPFGLVQHFYMPHLEKYTEDGTEIETYSQARANLPGIRRRPWWDVRIDPAADSWEPDGNARWCAFRDLYTMDQVTAHPLLTYRDDLHPTKSLDLAEGGTQTRKMRGQDPDWAKLIEVWWVYDKSNKTFFALSPGSMKPLMDPREWPIYWEALPYSYLAFNEQVDSNVPICFPAIYADQQTELNKNRTLMAELVKRLRRVVIGQRGAFQDADRARLEEGNLGIQEFFFADGSLADALGQVQLGSFPQELLLYDAKIKEDIREAIGLSQMDRAQRVNVQSAFEAQAIQTGSDLQTSRPEEKFEEFWADILRRFQQTLRQTLTSEVLVPIVGSADAMALQAEGEYVNVTPDQIKGEYDIQVRVGSTLPENHEQNFAKAVQLIALLRDHPGANQLELARIAIEESGFDSKRLGMTPEAMLKAQQMLEQQGLNGPANAKPNGKAAPGNTGGLDANFVRSMNPKGAA